MKWTRQVLRLLPGVLIGIVLILSVVLFFLEEPEYKHLTAWGAWHLLDSHLVIEGPFNIDVSEDLLLASEGISLTANDGSYRLSVGKLNLSLSLDSYLRTGTFWLNKLELEDINLEVMEGPEHSDFDLDDLRFPPIIIEQAHLTNVSFTYRELPPGTTHTFLLNELTTRDLGEYLPVTIRATGLFEGQSFVLTGTFDSVAQLLDRQHPHRVELKLNSPQVNAQVQGTVTEPLTGRGLDLQITLEIPRVRDIIEIVSDETPLLGSLHGSMILHGDYASPRLEAIDLHLQRGQEVDLIVRGMIDNVLSGTELDLHLDGMLSNPDVLSWLLVNTHGRVQRLQVSGRMHEDADGLSLRDMDVSAETVDGLKLQLSGSANVHPEGYKLTRADAGFALSFSAPTLGATNLLDLRNVPGLGPVSGSFALALSRDAIAIYSVDIGIGSESASRILLKGDVGYFALNGELELPGLNLQTDIQAVEVAQLARLFYFPLPLLGPARLRGTLKTQGAELQLAGARLDIGTKRSATLQATGLLAMQLNDPSKLRIGMDIDIRATKITQLAAPFGYALPDLGKTHVTGRLESKEHELRISDIKILMSPADKPLMQINGDLTAQSHEGSSSINVNYDVATSQLIAAFSNLEPGNLGRLQGNAIMSRLDNDWSIESYGLSSIQTDLYELQISGSYEGLENKNYASANSSLIINNPAELGEALGIDLGSIAPFRQRGLLTMKEDRLSYDGNTLIGDTNSTIKIGGYLKDGKSVLAGSIIIPVLHLTDFGLGPPEPGKEPPQPARAASDAPYIFSRKLLNLEFLNALDLDLIVSIDEVEGNRLRINSIKGKLELEDGRLAMPMDLVFDAGSIETNLNIALMTVPTFGLSILADDISLGPVMSQFSDDVPIQGYSNLQLDLQTRGSTAHEMASNLSGSASLGLENVRLRAHYIEALSLDVFGWAVSKSKGKDSYYNLNCVVLTFGVDSGEVRSEDIIADGPKMSIGGQINLNLAEETLDIVLIPKQKKRVFSSPSPVKIHGEILDPKVHVIPVKAAMYQIGAYSLGSRIYIPVRAFENLWSLLSDGDKTGGGCENIDKLRKAN